MTFSTDELRDDGFLDGRLRIAQPKHGYRAGTDAVMLAAACPARPGQSVLELGCGAGAAILCLAARVPNLDLTGLELQPGYADLARRNAAANGVVLTVTEGNLTDMPAELTTRSFDHVLMNPPYFLDGTRAASGRGVARHENAPMGTWVKAALRRLRTGGTLTLIQRADRLDSVLSAVSGPAGDIRILPIASRADRPAGRVILSARKGAGGALVLLAPFILHAAPRHEADGEDLSTAAQSVLRGGAAISL